MPSLMKRSSARVHGLRALPTKGGPLTESEQFIAASEEWRELEKVQQRRTRTQSS